MSENCSEAVSPQFTVLEPLNRNCDLNDSTRIFAVSCGVFITRAKSATTTSADPVLKSARATAKKKKGSVEIKVARPIHVIIAAVVVGQLVVWLGTRFWAGGACSRDDCLYTN